MHTPVAKSEVLVDSAAVSTGSIQQAKPYCNWGKMLFDVLLFIETLHGSYILAIFLTLKGNVAIY
jgi:hypothetical protein